MPDFGMLPEGTDGRHFVGEGEAKQPSITSAFSVPGVIQSSGTSAGSMPYDHAVRFRLKSKLRRGPRQVSLLTVALVSIVSLVAIAARIALCYSYQNRAKNTGLLKRNLSDVGDEKELSEILEQCVDLEEELAQTSRALTTSENGWHASNFYHSEPALGLARSMHSQMPKRDSSPHLQSFGSYSESLSEPGAWGEPASYYFDEELGWGGWGASFAAVAPSVAGSQTLHGMPVEPQRADVLQSTSSQQEASHATLSQQVSDGTSSTLLVAFDPNAWLEATPQQGSLTDKQQQWLSGSGRFASAYGNAPASQIPIHGVSKADEPAISKLLPPQRSNEGQFSGTPLGAIYEPFVLNGMQQNNHQSPRESEGGNGGMAAWGYQEFLPENILLEAYPEDMLQQPTMTGMNAAFHTPVHLAAGADSIPAALMPGTPWEWLTQHREEQGKTLPKTAGEEGAHEVVLPGIQRSIKSETTQTAQGVQAVWDPQGSSSSAVAVASTSIPSSAPEKVYSHPYVKLPVVNPEDVRRTFRRNIAFSSVLFERFSLNIYVRMRALFAKPSLKASQVDALLSQCEYLVNYALHRLTAAPTKLLPFFVSRKLAELFFMFDYVVCTIELLQEKMDTGSWWEEFVSNFYTEYYFPADYQSKRDSRRRLPTLINRLSKALSIYKEGARPPPQDIITLKRSIFKLLGKHGLFEHDLWNLWKKDDADYRNRNEEDSETE
ncbi:hypothetical protein, conserved [Eimeria praecox]|uniref:Uncharacterized protein n=1 Tax=Eimeria praecox TaxID=51316 RepID=U6GYV6_9EIME|nr:hypothetical protein, conserved [Eimeria praecox]